MVTEYEQEKLRGFDHFKSPLSKDSSYRKTTQR